MWYSYSKDRQTSWTNHTININSLILLSWEFNNNQCRILWLCGITLFIYICHRAWENRSYIHIIHLYVSWHLSHFLYVLSKVVIFIKFFMEFCTYDDILDTIWITDRKLLHFKLSKSGQILSVDKTGVPRLSHIFIKKFWYNICIYMYIAIV